MMTLPPLYKRNARGSVQEWTITYGENDDGTAFYEMKWGQQNGKMQTERTQIVEGKNLGKANATTAYEQAGNEACSMWKKKQDRNGYYQVVASEKQFRPMLAKSYNAPGSDLSKLKDGKHIFFPCYYQPKLDGIRCTAQKMSPGYVRLSSRQGKEFESLKHIQDELALQLPMTTSIHLDGELYVHGEEFQDLVSAIKRNKPSDKSHLIQYHIYDLYDPSQPTLDFVERKQLLTNLITENSIIKLVKTITVDSAHMVERHLRDNCALGYEGIMLRNGLGAYKVDGRSADLQKVKLFQDKEFLIVGAEENKGKLKDTCVFLCEAENGAIFKCMPEGTESGRKKMYKDWKSGKIKNGDLLTVRFFSLTTSDKPVPRFPIGRLRNYE